MKRLPGRSAVLSLSIACCAWATVGHAQSPTYKPAGPLPANAAAICQAAADTLNRGQPLERMRTTVMPADVSDALKLDVGPNASSPEVARMTIDGRSLAAVSIDSGGTCHSSEVAILSGDLKSRLSSADRGAGDIGNTGEDSWGFGLSEEMVVVLGQPMVLSYASDPTEFHLSAVTRDGGIVPTCSGSLKALDKRRLTFASDDKVCRGILDGRQLPLALSHPAPDQSMSLAHPPGHFVTTRRQVADNSLPGIRFRDSVHAAEVEYTLLMTGKVDLDNSGRPRDVGLVSFFDGNSSAGCGTFSDTQILPVYLDDKGRADPSTPANQPMADGFPHGMRGGKLVGYEGKTYVELSPEQAGLSSEVWMVGDQGPTKVCAFQLTRFVVSPVAADQ